MHTATHPAQRAQERAQTAPVPLSALGIEARLAGADAAMTVRLEQAALAAAARAPETVLDLADVITGPVQPPGPRTPYTTPAAATLQRAARRLEAGGWCRGGITSPAGGRCLHGAVQAEAPDPRVEQTAMDVLLDVVRDHWPDAATVPAANDRHVPDRAAAVQLLDAAAARADTRGL